jgi:hypothetical protein
LLRQLRTRRPRLQREEDWIAWIRVAAAPFALLEVVIERGNYPSGHEAWAWSLGLVFSTGATALLAAHRRRVAEQLLPGLALVFDTAIVSGYVVLYGFEPNSPVRQLLILVVVEAALRYGRRGGLWALASTPALALFEWRASDRLDVPYDPGHVVFPIGLQLLAGLIVGALAERTQGDETTSRAS